jgi:hypothetical protein
VCPRAPGRIISARPATVALLPNGTRVRKPCRVVALLWSIARCDENTNRNAIDLFRNVERQGRGPGCDMNAQDKRLLHLSAAAVVIEADVHEPDIRVGKEFMLQHVPRPAGLLPAFRIRPGHRSGRYWLRRGPFDYPEPLSAHIGHGQIDVQGIEHATDVHAQRTLGQVAAGKVQGDNLTACRIKPE